MKTLWYAVFPQPKQKGQLVLEGVFLKQEYLFTQQNEAQSPKNLIPIACSKEKAILRE